MKTLFYGLLTLLLSLASARAEIFYYEDADGTVRFSDEPPAVAHYKVRPDKIAEEFRVAIRNYSKDELRGLIRKFSAQYGVEPALAEAVVKAESEYDAMAVSKKGARGLMQLMPETARSLGVEDAHNPLENLKGGIQHLKGLLAKFDGNVDLAVAAYNAGEKAVSKHKGVPPYAETVDYVSKVRKYYSRFADASKSTTTLLNP